MPRAHRQLPQALAAAALVLASSVAEAQWVVLARRAIGRVEQMSQAQPNGGVTYDTAAVMLEVPADKVYATAARLIKANEAVKVTSEDDANRSIQFTNGRQIAGIQITPLADGLSHMMITSAHQGAQPNAASQVLDNVLRVCREMNVECRRARE